MDVLKGELNSTSTYIFVRTYSSDERQISSASYRYSQENKCQNLWIRTAYILLLAKVYKNAFKSRFISNSSHCSTTILSKYIISALTAVKDNVIKHCEPAFSKRNVNYFWAMKNSSEVIEKLRMHDFQGSQVSSFDFSTLYTSLLHYLIKAKLLSPVNWWFIWFIQQRVRNVPLFFF